jgi:hypothetical protein
MKSEKKSKTQSNAKQIEDIKNLTLELIKNGYGSDMIGMDAESLVKLALKRAKQVYKSREILDRIKDEDFL